MSTSQPSHEIIIVPVIGEPRREELRQQCYDVRIDVFHREQGFPLDTEIDDLDETATHFLLRLTPSLAPIGTIRCVKTSHYYKLGRLAVLKDYRQYRFGRALVQSLHHFVKADAKATTSGSRVSDTVKVVSHSQIPVKGFYGKFGYEEEGEEFDEDGAPHQKMVVHLSLSD
ncbi:acyl-CoA N-acyltransferase [Ganoderma leucocontextum]|nr:acyl-CoA N-acyltransferase [Ganoderma leucocontextum]